MEMQPTSDPLRILKIVFLGLLGGQAVFIATGLAVAAADVFPRPFEGLMIPSAVALVAAGGALGAAKAFRTARMRSIADAGGNAERMRLYFTTTIVFLALLEAALVILIVVFLLTGNLALLLPVPLCLAMAVTKYPSKERVERDLGMNLS